MNRPRITKIVTHPGHAHMDDFLGVCIALYKTGATLVERREPTLLELVDSSVMLIDTGRKYEPEFSNFDHHGLPNLPCALHQIVKYYNMEEAFKKTYPWYPTVNRVDLHGPDALAKDFGLKREQLDALHNPIGEWALGEFGRREIVSGAFIQMMSKIGQAVCQRAERYYEQFPRDYEILEKLLIHEIRGVKYLVLPDRNPHVALRQFAKDHHIGIIVKPDNPQRSEGWKFERINGEKRVDFNAAKRSDLPPQQTLNFVHDESFVAVCNHPNADIKAIISNSLIEPKRGEPFPDGIIFAAKLMQRYPGSSGEVERSGELMRL